ncbi:hypothetical protein GI584_08095 [Gracilibacillus salitolerans]|uniref:DUF2512 family protein n=1 Tax=Gracilibacillus salitolerans TaxID=2663022 RepID=A0A5Q2TH48_9BACI|nr:hypothetical protein [Gracilibacillus salitolerans]QGH33985.1 hypothetical protein GI584_08095 [Gracilibacillus salitolerans]
MMGLIIKLIVCPITVIIASLIFPNVEYANLWQPIIVGLVLAVLAQMMEVMMLKEDTFVLSTVMDFVAATLIVYFISLFFVNAEVTFMGALFTGVLLAITEIPQHSYLIKSGKIAKAPA